MTDLEYFDKIINIKDKLELYINDFCWLYPFTNENILGYYKELDFKGKTVLVPTSSGDHALNAWHLGAESIETFDTNPISKYYVELKIAAIKALSLEEFIYFFYNKNYIIKQKHYLNKDLYFNKIRKYLNENFRLFWDYALSKYSYKDLYKSFLFTQDFLDFVGIFEANIYLKEYYKFQNKIKNIKINYNDINIRNLDKLNKTFDIIILSNIPTFIDKIYKQNELEELKRILEKIKKDSSKIVLNYYYSYKLERYSDSIMYNKSKVKEYFDDENYKYYEFESSDSLSYNKNIRKYLLKKKDVVLMTK